MALRGVSVKLAVSMVLMLALGWADLDRPVAADRRPGGRAGRVC